MGKKAKKKQQQQALKTAPAAAQPITKPIAKPVVAAPTAFAAVAAPATRPVAPPSAAPVSVPPVQAAPKVVKMAKSATTPEGVIVNIVRNSAGNPIYLLIQEYDTGNTLVAHKTANPTISDYKIGDIVRFTVYAHEGRPSAKLESKAGIDETVVTRLANLKKLGTYKIMPMQTWLGSSSEDLEHPDIIGTTPDGEIIIAVEV